MLDIAGCLVGVQEKNSEHFSKSPVLVATFQTI
jgi:hypothetical protein